MDVIVRKQYKSVAPFIIKNAPDLIVLTGENGTGKTQLLEYLYQASRFTDEGFFMQSNDELAPEYSIPTGDSLSEGNVTVYEHPSELLSDGIRLQNAVLRKVQTPSVEIGESYNYQTLYAKGENISQKHLYFKTQSMFADLSTVDLDIVTDRYQEMLGIKKSSKTHDAKYPTIDKADLEIIKKIEEQFPGVDYTRDPFYYIAFQKIPETTVFSANLKFLYVQYWARKKAGMDLPQAPWETFNSIGRLLNFKFELDEPKIDENKFDVRLRDREKKIFISPKSLSSGEKVIFSLFVAMYSTTTSTHNPSVLLFDEPDAFLHPTLSNTMVKVITQEFIKNHNIKVILTTHSPSTVALVPEQSVYKMDKGRMEKCSKKEAIKALTSGLSTLSINYENVKQVFVEADNDNRYLSEVYLHGTILGLLNNDIQLRFVNVGNEKNGGCTTLHKVVNDLVNAGNSTVYGIIDWDGKNSSNKTIKVLGNGRRYSIDNYYTDPLTMALVLIGEKNEKIKVGFAEHDSLVSFNSKDDAQIQAIIDTTISRLETVISTDVRSDNAKCDYRIADGRSFQLPKWFLEHKGHNIVEHYRKAFPFFNRFAHEKDLLAEIFKVYDNYPGIIPIDVIETLAEIQEL